MEVQVVCTRLLVNVCLLLALQDEKCCGAKTGDAVFPRLDPDRLQFFEFESIKLKCEALDFSSEWRVMRKLKEKHTHASQWKTSDGFSSTSLALASDSGEYWCENKHGERSSTVDVTVTDGDVILESPSVPVMEGDSVTLSCRKKREEPNLAADFFKDGSRLKTGYRGDLTISNVSRSDEGFYKCRISGSEESPESWLSVRADRVMSSDVTPSNTSSAEEIPETPSTHDTRHPFTFLPVFFTIDCVAVLLLAVGLFYHGEHRASEEGCVGVMSVVIYSATNEELKKKRELTPETLAWKQLKAATWKIK